MVNLSKKALYTIISIIVLLIAGWYCIYLWALPAAVSNPKVISFVEKTLYDTMKLNLAIDSPELKTSVAPVITFKVKEFKLTKNNERLLEVKNLNTIISFRDLIIKRIIIKRFGFDSFYADVNKLMALAPKQEKKKPAAKLNWNIDIFDALLYVRNAEIVYNLDKDTNLHILAKDVGTNNAKKVDRRVYFKVLVDLHKNNENIRIVLLDRGKVKISHKTLFINDLPVYINKSKLFVKLVANRRIKYDLSVYSKDFYLKDVLRFVEANLVIPNGKEMLSCISTDMRGKFDFNFHLKKKKLDGNINLKEFKMHFVPLNNLPVTLTQGTVLIDNKKIQLKDFKGYYCSNPKTESIDFTGEIKDYLKTMDMNIVANTFITDEFTSKYLTKMVGVPLNLIGDAGTRIIIKSKNNKFDIIGYSRLLPGEDILVDKMSLSPKNFERIVKADLHFEDMMLKINAIDYYIGVMKEKEIKRRSIMFLSGNFDCKKLKVLDMGVTIPEPLPSEFFNLFAGKRFFRKGNVQGHIYVNNRGKYPVLVANMAAKDIRIPALRLKIENADIKTDKKHIHLSSYGRFKRSHYKFDGELRNALIFPIVVTDVDLGVDFIDIAKILKSFNQQNTQAVKSQPIVAESNVDVDDEAAEADDAYVFDTGLIIIEDCKFHMKKAVFNAINMGNLHALLTLDKHGVLQIQSNKFDFAEGISTLKVRCDLMKHKYYVRLGVKDVNSDIIATSLLNLKKEISGKAKGLIELDTDDSFKLNGVIKFDIQNGTIGKVGFLEYVLKFAALFRNPMAMISPSTLVDLVNIPEGNFDRIHGELTLKDNKIVPLKIKSRASQLSSFIIGTFDLESRDAILRIYTKMSNKKKGASGVLRNISLNALANRIPLGNSNESNYYAAEIEQLPDIDAEDKDCQIFLTKVDGDVEHNNFLSSLKRIK